MTDQDDDNDVHVKLLNPVKVHTPELYVLHTCELWITNLKAPKELVRKCAVDVVIMLLSLEVQLLNPGLLGMLERQKEPLCKTHSGSLVASIILAVLLGGRGG